MNMKTNLRKLSFALEALPNQIFHGYTMGEEWNGWAVPYFDFDESKKIAHAHENSLNIVTLYDEEDDKFTFRFSDEEEEYQATIMDNRKLYPLGSGVWIWEEA